MTRERVIVELATNLGLRPPGEGRGFWIHLDVDVLDRSIMPAVDSPNPKGLLFEELEGALRVFLGHGGARGIELSIYDPDLDPEGSAGDRLVDCLVRSFSPS